MIMTQKDFAEIQTFLSSTRLNTYGQNLPVKKQLKEYRRNIKLCRDFYPELDFFEVTLRNAIDSALTSFVNGADWMTTLPLDQQTLYKITEVKNRLQKQNKQITHDRIISELTLGFWTTLFSKKYNQYKFQSYLVKKVFVNCPKSQKSIQNIQVYVNEIRELRNRVCHYERICHYPDIKERHERLLECTGWISPVVLKIAKRKL